MFSSIIDKSDKAVMVYAGFWLRLIAMLIDGLVFLPVPIIYLYLRTVSWELAFIISGPYCFLFAFYNIFCLGRWGQTIGKMLVQIKVVRLDGSDIEYRDAFMRHSVDCVFAMLSSIAFTMALISIPKMNMAAGDWSHLNTLFQNSLPWWWLWAKNGSDGWVYSELAVLLTNKKKRAIQDFIGGTVVIRTAP